MGQINQLTPADCAVERPDQHPAERGPKRGNLCGPAHAADRSTFRTGGRFRDSHRQHNHADDCEWNGAGFGTTGVSRSRRVPIPGCPAHFRGASDITSTLVSGQLGGLLQARDQQIPRNPKPTRYAGSGSGEFHQWSANRRIRVETAGTGARTCSRHHLPRERARPPVFRWRSPILL